MKKQISVFLLLMLLGALSNCATIMSGGGSPYKVTVESEVPDTEVSYIEMPVFNDPAEPRVTTQKAPLTVQYTVKKVAYFKCEAPGYRTSEIWPEQTVNPWAWVSFLFFPLGPTVDAMTASTFKLTDDRFQCPMEKTGAK
ncbi:MAG: hypothetical protein CVV45_10440 [Spirochaetae bacterium HGW-Spirochaetae-10]|jgi:hypothetical protein|nr:MAG: hypothetical protein CVV45_10440 [Spirochaetae bacterium HGW-Spirochaetae-10]